MSEVDRDERDFVISQTNDIRDKALCARTVSDIVDLLETLPDQAFSKSDTQIALNEIARCSGIPVQLIEGEYQRVWDHLTKKKLVERDGEEWEPPTPVGFASPTTFAMSVSRFVRTGVKRDYVNRREFFDVYRGWAEARGLKAVGKMAFLEHLRTSNALKAHGVSLGFGHDGGAVVRGVKLAPTLAFTTDDDEL